MTKARLSRGKHPEVDRAEARLRKGDHAGALEELERSIADGGAAPRVWQLAAGIRLQAGQPGQAEELIIAGLKAHPDDTELSSLLGAALFDQQKFPRASRVLRRVLELEPDHAAALLLLGRTALQVGELDTARRHLERVCEIQPGNADAWIWLSAVLHQLRRPDDAIAAAEHAARRAPKNQNIQLKLADFFNDIGDLKRAVGKYRAIAQADPHAANAWLGLARLHKLRRGDSEGEALLAAAERQSKTRMPVAQRSTLHFALGKWHDDIGDFAAAFEHFRRANTLARRTETFDQQFSLQKRLTREAPKVFTRRFFARRGASMNPSEIPIFIVGMPRSGSTLLEELVARHPRVRGAGEAALVGTMIRDMELSARGEPDLLKDTGLDMTQSELTYPRLLGELSADELRGYADWMLQRLQSVAGDADRVIDKTLSNFAHVGLLKTLFPRAAVLHVRRHPLDTVISCYVQRFGSGAAMGWSNDLVWIARIFRLYRRHMQQWSELLGDQILDVDYEALVDDTPAQLRTVLAHCGLEWADDCLAPQETNVRFGTASAWQIKQPIYKSSKQRWKRYAPYLQSVVNELSEFIPESDAELASVGLKRPWNRRWKSWF